MKAEDFKLKDSYTIRFENLDKGFILKTSKGDLIAIEDNIRIKALCDNICGQLLREASSNDVSTAVITLTLETNMPTEKPQSEIELEAYTKILSKVISKTEVFTSDDVSELISVYRKFNIIKTD